MSQFRKFFSSISHAFQGLQTAYLEEKNFRIQIFIAIIVIILAIFLRITKIEWLIILITIGIVLSLELLNSMVEKVLDIINPAKDPKIKIIKDISAAAVLIVSLMAVIIGLTIFIPYLK